MRARTVADELFSGPGFVEFGLAAVVKFGGSLLADVNTAKQVAATFGSLPDDQRILVFPGGGPTDNVIEMLARKAGLTGATINPACMRALDQTGILLAALHPALSAVETFAEARAALRAGQIPVLLPGRLILALDVFTRDDIITSDSLGAYFAFLVGAERYVVLTDVDGVFESVQSQRLIRQISTAKLTSMGATSVDRCLGPLLDAVGMAAWVLNGARPERLAELLGGGEPLGTRIVPER